MDRNLSGDVVQSANVYYTMQMRQSVRWIPVSTTEHVTEVCLSPEDTSVTALTDTKETTAKVRFASGISFSVSSPI